MGKKKKKNWFFYQRSQKSSGQPPVKKETEAPIRIGHLSSKPKVSSFLVFYYICFLGIAWERTDTLYGAVCGLRSFGLGDQSIKSPSVLKGQGSS